MDDAGIKMSGEAFAVIQSEFYEAMMGSGISVCVHVPPQEFLDGKNPTEYISDYFTRESWPLHALLVSRKNDLDSLFQKAVIRKLPIIPFSYDYPVTENFERWDNGRMYSYLIKPEIKMGFRNLRIKISLSGPMSADQINWLSDEIKTIFQ